MIDVHQSLIERQTDEELERKATKARRRGFWTQEDLDDAKRKAKRLYVALGWNKPDAR